MHNPLKGRERPKDECGVFDLYKHPGAAKLTCFGLYALQHRGQESAGISVNRSLKDKIFFHKRMGFVPAIFNMVDPDGIEGGSAIGHVRYSTAGDYPVPFNPDFTKQCMGQYAKIDG